MRTIRTKFHYSDYSQVDSNTTPGLCYSVAELLRRVQKGEQLPLLTGAAREGLDERADLDMEMDRHERHPFYDAEHDEIEAFEYREDVDTRLRRKSVKSPKKALKKENKAVPPANEDK